MPTLMPSTAHASSLESPSTSRKMTDLALPGRQVVEGGASTGAQAAASSRSSLSSVHGSTGSAHCAVGVEAGRIDGVERVQGCRRAAPAIPPTGPG